MRRIRYALPALLACLFASSRASAQCLQVPSQYATISAAVAALPATFSSNQCITVSAGTYDESVAISNATNGFSLTLTASGTVQVVPPSGTAGFTVGSANVTISGFTMAPANSLAYGVDITSSPATVTGLMLLDTSGEITTAGLYVAPSINGVTLSNSTITVTAAQYAAYFDSDSSNNTIQNSSLANQLSGGVADGVVFAGGSFNSVSNSFIQTTQAIDAALYFDGASSNTLSGSTVSDLGPGGACGVGAGGDALIMNGAGGNTVTSSTITSNQADDGAATLYQSNSNRFSSSYIADASQSNAMQLFESDLNTVSQSVLSTNSGRNCYAGALYLEGSSTNTFTQSFIEDPDTVAPGTGGAIYVSSYSVFGAADNVISQDTVAVNGAAESDIIIAGQTSGTAISQTSVIDNGGNTALYFDDYGGGSTGNTITSSQLQTLNGSNATVEVWGSSQTTFTSVSIANPGGGDGLDLYDGAANDTLSASTVMTSGATDGAVFMSAALSDTISNSVLSDNDGGQGAYLFGGSGNKVVSSTLTAVNSGDAALFLWQESGDTVSSSVSSDLGDSYGLWVYGSSNTFVSGSAFASAAGAAAVVQLDSPGLTLLSDSFSTGVMGLEFVDTTPGLSASALTFKTLTAGATDMEFLSGVWDSTFSTVDFADSPSNHEANVDASGVAAGNTIAFANAFGPLAGHNYSDDPNGVVTFFSTAPAPGAPTGLTATALGVSSIAWTWNAVANATSYKFYFSTGLPALSLPGTSFTQTGLSTNTSYGGAVTAVDSSGESPESSSVSTYTLAAAPLALAATAVYASSATFTWSADGNPNGTAYKLVYTPVGGSATTAAAGTAPPFTLTGLVGGTTYTFTVDALNGDNIVTVGASTSAVTTGAPAISTTIGSAGGTVSITQPSGSVTLTIPPGAFTTPASVSLVEVVSFSTYPNVSPGIADLRGTGIGIYVQVTPAEEPTTNVPITITYTPAALGAANPNTLFIARWDPVAMDWVPLPSTVNTGNDTVSATTDHLSLFQLMSAAAAANLAEAKVFPNPFRPALGETDVTFADLPANATLKIYDILGERVRELNADSGGIATWDGRNMSGNSCASGVYFVLAGSGSRRSILKVAIQR